MRTLDFYYSMITFWFIENLRITHPLCNTHMHYRVSYSWLLFSNQTHPEGITSRPVLGKLTLRPLITRSGCVFGQDTRGRSKAFPECWGWGRGGAGGSESSASLLELPDAFCSGFPAVTSHPQAPCIPDPDHTLVSLRHRKLTQVPEVIRAFWGLEGSTVICMKGPSPSQGMKRGRRPVGTLC